MEKRIDVEALKKIQIEILDVLDEFCKKNKINYWIDSGTLLGAIRHSGYIPWDDDIDIGMLREDYDKFLQTFNNSNRRYQAYSVENNQKFCYPFAKVLDTKTILYEPNKKGNKLAVNIDVFVYDNAPDDIQEINKMFKKRDFYQKCLFIKNKYYEQKKLYEKMLLFILWFLLLPFSKSYFAKKIVKNCKLYADKRCNKVGNFSAYTDAYCEKDVFDSFTVSKFEGKEYPIPIGYDKWLRAFYGNYMELPPEDKRVSHHVFEAYYKD